MRIPGTLLQIGAFSTCWNTYTLPTLAWEKTKRLFALALVLESGCSVLPPVEMGFWPLQPWHKCPKGSRVPSWYWGKRAFCRILDFSLSSASSKVLSWSPVFSSHQTECKFLFDDEGWVAVVSALSAAARWCYSRTSLRNFCLRDRGFYTFERAFASQRPYRTSKSLQQQQ